MKQQRFQLRLHSDHHHLVLEYFDAKQEQWSLLGETHFEYITATELITWLRSFSKIKRAGCVLLLSEDFFKFEAIDMATEFMLEPHCLVDSIIHEAKREIVTLERASIEPYVSALKACKLKLLRISPVQHEDFNLLPWREAKARRQRWQKMGYLSILPALSLVLSVGVGQWQEGLLQQAQNQNHQLTKQWSALTEQQSALHLAQVLPLIQKLLAQPDLLAVSLKADGSISLQGIGSSSSAVNAMLKEVAAFPELAPKSMHDLSLQDGAKGGTWSVGFELSGANS